MWKCVLRRKEGTLHKSVTRLQPCVPFSVDPHVSCGNMWWRRRSHQGVKSSTGHSSWLASTRMWKKLPLGGDQEEVKERRRGGKTRWLEQHMSDCIMDVVRKWCQGDSGCSLQRGGLKRLREQEVKDLLVSQRWKLKPLGCNKCQSESSQSSSSVCLALLCRARERDAHTANDIWPGTPILTWQWWMWSTAEY